MRNFYFLLFLLSAFPVTAFAASVTWFCDRCTPASGTAIGTTNWSQAGIQLAPGINVLTVTALDDNGQTSTDTITVTYAPTFPGNTLAGAWGFEETSGLVVDSSGNSNDGTLFNGASRTAQGHSRQGITLNGSNQYVQVSSAGSLNYTQSFTFSAWVKPPSTAQTGWRSIISKNGIGGLYASSGSPCLPGTPSAWFFTNGTSASTQNFNACYPTPLPAGQWTHLAATYNGAALRLYLNGALVTTTTASGYIDPTAPIMTLQIGSSRFDEVFVGEIDEVRTYNFAIPLSASPNTTPGNPCGYTSQADRTDMAKVSVVGDMNCSVIQTTPPVVVKFPASATGLKVGASATGFKFGQPAQ